MDFFYRYPGGPAHRLHFRKVGLSLSTTKTYKALIIEGQCREWTEESAPLSYKAMFERGKDWDYKVVANLTCWDVLALLEMEHVSTEELCEMCYPPSVLADADIE